MGFFTVSTSHRLATPLFGGTSDSVLMLTLDCLLELMLE
jgi:hypothetical protein